MEKILIYIKHNLRFLWDVIEKINDRLFSLFFSKRLRLAIDNAFNDSDKNPFSLKRLNRADAESLFEFINCQKESDLIYFKPHGFDIDSIRRQLQRKSFLMMGVFDKNRLIGYFFLRFFVIRRCFVGRLTDMKYRGKGAGKQMNKMMYNISWSMNFRCLSTISKNNYWIMEAHKSNTAMIVLKELKNDYLLVEFTRGS